MLAQSFPRPSRKHDKPIPAAEAARILAKSAGDAITGYARAQAISSEHPTSSDTYFFDWPSTQPTPADGVTGVEISLSATERRGVTPRAGAVAVSWVYADGRTVEAFACTIAGSEDPQVQRMPSDDELVRAAMTVTWLLVDAASYKEVE